VDVSFVRPSCGWWIDCGWWDPMSGVW